MGQKTAFGIALMQIRKKRGIAQERLGPSQSFVSSVERGIRSPTLQKMEEFAEILDISPVTLMAYAYLDPNDNVDTLLARVRIELEQLGR